MIEFSLTLSQLLLTKAYLICLGVFEFLWYIWCCCPLSTMHLLFLLRLFFCLLVKIFIEWRILLVKFIAFGFKYLYYRFWLFLLKLRLFGKVLPLTLQELLRAIQLLLTIGVVQSILPSDSISHSFSACIAPLLRHVLSFLVLLLFVNLLLLFTLLLNTLGNSFKVLGFLKEVRILFHCKNRLLALFALWKVLLYWVGGGICVSERWYRCSPFQCCCTHFLLLWIILLKANVLITFLCIILLSLEFFLWLFSWSCLPLLSSSPCVTIRITLYLIKIGWIS